MVRNVNYYILCPKPETPSGGVWLIHRLVKLLNEAGRPARVIQTEPFNVWWDSNPIPEEYIQQLGASVDPNGTLIVPEVLFPPSDRFRSMKRILLVQNRMWLPQEITAYNLRPETIVCSRYLYNHMERNYSIRPLGIVRPYLDGFWHPTPKQANRTLVIARRNPYHEKMREMLEADGFPVTYIDKPEGVSQNDLFTALSNSEYYVHLTHPEGFPMACLEAMRMGTIVVGTTGGGGAEFLFGSAFDGQTALVVQDPETGRYSTDDFLRGIMDALRILRADAEMRSRIWETAYSWSLRYTAQATTKELLDVLG